jgi:small conductance mechanosensitive channel
MNDAVETINRSAGPILVVLLVAVVAYIALRLIGRVVTRVVRRRLERDASDPLSRSLTDVETRKRLATVTSLVDWLFRLVIIVAASLAILIALDLTPVILFVVVLLAVVAVVARDVIRDYVAGILIVLENQYAIGDWVRIAGEYGEVEALALRRTILRTMGGDVVMVPNGDIRTVTNRTRAWARINLDIGIADPSHLEAARAATEEAGRRLVTDPAVGESVIEPPRLMMVSDITDAGIRLLIWGRVRAAERFAVEGEFRRLLLEAFREAGVELVAEQRVRVIDPPPRNPS